MIITSYACTIIFCLCNCKLTRSCRTRINIQRVAVFNGNAFESIKRYTVAEYKVNRAADCHSGGDVRIPCNSVPTAFENRICLGCKNGIIRAGLCAAVFVNVALCAVVNPVCRKCYILSYGSREIVVSSV